MTDYLSLIIKYSQFSAEMIATSVKPNLEKNSLKNGHLFSHPKKNAYSFTPGGLVMN